MNYLAVYPFNSRKCNICIQEGQSSAAEVKQCTRCQLISYCGIEHQKKDYKRHKPFCKWIHEIAPEVHVFDKSSSDEVFVNKKIFLGAYMANKLNRELTYHERSVSI